MGLLHSATGSWTLPIALLLVIALVQIFVAHLLSSGRAAGVSATGPAAGANAAGMKE
jgi:CP family cyanate transporter-like MFS transporter